MIRFGVVLTVVVAAIGLLGWGIYADSLLFVYLAIGVAAAAALMLVIGVLIWREEIFGPSPVVRAAVPVVDSRPATAEVPAAELRSATAEVPVVDSRPAAAEVPADSRPAAATVGTAADSWPAADSRAPAESITPAAVSEPEAESASPPRRLEPAVQDSHRELLEPIARTVAMHAAGRGAEPEPAAEPAPAPERPPEAESAAVIEPAAETAVSAATPSAAGLAPPHSPVQQAQVASPGSTEVSQHDAMPTGARQDPLSYRSPRVPQVDELLQRVRRERASIWEPALARAPTSGAPKSADPSTGEAGTAAGAGPADADADAGTDADAGIAESTERESREPVEVVSASAGDPAALHQAASPDQAVPVAPAVESIQHGAESVEQATEQEQSGQAEVPSGSEPADLGESQPADPGGSEPADLASEVGPADATEVSESADENDPIGADGQVTVVPGIIRYHRSACILIRFLGADDLETMTRTAAEEADCVACRACQPDKALADP